MKGVDLTIHKLLARAVDIYPDRELATRRLDGSMHRYTYADAAGRIAQLGHALDDLGLDPGERVSVAATNHYRHFELYFGPCCTGRSLHTCNVRLPDEYLSFTVNDAESDVLFVDPGFVEQVEAVADDLESVERYVVLDDAVPETDLEPVDAYEDLLAGQPERYDWPVLDGGTECGLCHTSGTTGRPKGVPYTHRGVYLHTMMMGHVEAHAISNADVVMPAVSMFHANGWGYPYAATFVGAKQVFHGGHTDSATLASLIAEEGVTMSAGVPTIWIDLADYLEANPEADISTIDRINIGGSAPPKSLVRRYEERYGASILQGYGMTELTPVGAMCSLRKEVRDADPDTRLDYQTKAGLPVPGIELRVRDEADGDRDEPLGELEARGPWVIDGYKDRPQENAESFTDDGWFRTGDIATQDELGYIDIVDRKGDLIKSGGEWISTVDLENALMDHPAIAEAAVVPVVHEKWQERPLACIATDEAVSEEQLREHLRERFPKWWVPDAFETFEELPRTTVGKFDKAALEERLDGTVTRTGDED